MLSLKKIYTVVQILKRKMWIVYKIKFPSKIFEFFFLNSKWNLVISNSWSNIISRILIFPSWYNPFEWLILEGVCPFEALGHTRVKVVSWIKAEYITQYCLHSVTLPGLNKNSVFICSNEAFLCSYCCSYYTNARQKRCPVFFAWCLSHEIDMQGIICGHK